MNTPNYYAIIPANVRYCEKLPASAKLLYGEITALANLQGYCWAGNHYFSKVYNVDPKTISRWISKLEKLGFITVDIDQSRQATRHIYVTSCTQKDHQPVRKKITHNNTVNNKENNTVTSKDVSYHGDPEINQLTKFFKEKLGTDLDGTIKQNRNMCSLLIRKAKKNFPGDNLIVALEQLIEAGLKDEFHGPRLTNFRYLYYNFFKIINAVRPEKTESEKIEELKKAVGEELG